jgi:hypothetical protein
VNLVSATRLAGETSPPRWYGRKFSEGSRPRPPHLTSVGHLLTHEGVQALLQPMRPSPHLVGPGSNRRRTPGTGALAGTACDPRSAIKLVEFTQRAKRHGLSGSEGAQTSMAERSPCRCHSSQESDDFVPVHRAMLHRTPRLLIACRSSLPKSTGLRRPVILWPCNMARSARARPHPDRRWTASRLRTTSRPSGMTQGLKSARQGSRKRLCLAHAVGGKPVRL